MPINPVYSAVYPVIVFGYWIFSKWKVRHISKRAISDGEKKENSFYHAKNPRGLVPSVELIVRASQSCVSGIFAPRRRVGLMMRAIPRNLILRPFKIAVTKRRKS